LTWTARIVVALVLGIGLMGGCSTAPTSREGKDELIRQATAALSEWNSDIPGLERFAQLHGGVMGEASMGGRRFTFVSKPHRAKRGLGSVQPLSYPPWLCAAARTMLAARRIRPHSLGFEDKTRGMWVQVESTLNKFEGPEPR